MKKLGLVIYPVSLYGFLFMLLISCEKDNNKNSSNPTNGKTTAVFNSNITYGKLTDQDGNEYKTVTIGSQTWMAENLRTTKYRNGDIIPKVSDNTEWKNLNSGAYCNYRNTNSNDTIATYGRLYNWFAVKDNRNLAPIGWHVPTQDEWSTLYYYLNTNFIAGTKLKENGFSHWSNSNQGGDNSSGFTALPGGFRLNVNGTYESIGLQGIWWNSTEPTSYGSTVSLFFNSSNVNIYVGAKTSGCSVRLVKDN